MSGRDDPALLDRIEELGVRSLVELVLAVVGLLLFLVFVAVLPGVDRVIPGLPVTIAALVSALVTVTIVLLLLRIAARARAVVQRLRINVPDVAVRSAAVVYWTVVFLAVVVAYEGFGAAVEPVMVEASLLWAYDMAFFLLGSVSLILVGYNLFHLLDPLAELFVTRLRSEAGPDPSGGESGVPIDPASGEDDDPRGPS